MSIMTRDDAIASQFCDGVCHCPNSERAYFYGVTEQNFELIIKKIRGDKCKRCTGLILK